MLSRVFNHGHPAERKLALGGKYGQKHKKKMKGVRHEILAIAAYTALAVVHPFWF